MMEMRRQDTDIRPRDAAGRELISVRGILEWAFATECASLDHDEVGAVAGTGFPRMAPWCRVEGVRVDVSVGRSLPHHDAEIVATVLRNSVSVFRQAIWVAELARTQRAPKWDLGVPRLQPREWQGRGRMAGKQGKSEVLRVVEYRSRRRGRVRRQELRVPCTWVPDVSQIHAARRDYLAWWSILLGVQQGLKRVDLDRFSVTDRMPPRTPWQKMS